MPTSVSVGETLFYKASFRGIHAARASLKIIEKKVFEKDSVYHIQFRARTRSAFDYIFPIDDKVDLWVDVKTFLPVKISENISEGNFKRSANLIFNRKNNYAIIDNDTLKIEESIPSLHILCFIFFESITLEVLKIKKYL